MGDVVSCKCVLKLNGLEGAPGTADSLAFVLPSGQGRDWHRIACYEAGKPEPSCGHPVWKYEKRDGRLHLTPSLLVTTTQFHTDYNWSVDFEECPAGVNEFDYFFSINPEMA